MHSIAIEKERSRDKWIKVVEEGEDWNGAIHAKEIMGRREGGEPMLEANAEGCWKLVLMVTS